MGLETIIIIHLLYREYVFASFFPHRKRWHTASTVIRHRDYRIYRRAGDFSFGHKITCLLVGVYYWRGVIDHRAPFYCTYELYDSAYLWNDPVGSYIFTISNFSHPTPKSAPPAVETRPPIVFSLLFTVFKWKEFREKIASSLA